MLWEKRPDSTYLMQSFSKSYREQRKKRAKEIGAVFQVSGLKRNEIVSLGEVPTVINTKWHKMAACFYWNVLQDCMAIDSSTLNRHKQWLHGTNLWENSYLADKHGLLNCKGERLQWQAKDGLTVQCFTGLGSGHYSTQRKLLLWHSNLFISALKKDCFTGEI